MHKRSKTTTKRCSTQSKSRRTAHSSNPHPLPSRKVLDPFPPGTSPVVRKGREAVTYHIPIFPPAPSPAQPVVPKTTISLPRYSTWTSGLHFHTTHTEYLRLVRGAIFVHVDGKTEILSAEAGGSVTVYGADKRVAPGLLITVPKYSRHE